jgi:hypothetical protein
VPRAPDVHHPPFPQPLQGLWGVSSLITFPVVVSLAHAWWHSNGAAFAALLGPAPWRHGLSWKPLLIPPTHIVAASGVAAVFSFMGQLFMLKAVLVFGRGKHDRRGSSPAPVAVLHAKGGPATGGRQKAHGQARQELAKGGAFGHSKGSQLRNGLSGQSAPAQHEDHQQQVCGKWLPRMKTARFCAAA